jgi:hypothetical protein
MIGRILPYALFVLMIILVYSFISKRKVKTSATKEKSISESIQHELEERV